MLTRKSRFALLILLVIPNLLAFSSAAAQEGEPIHWSYEGETGPDQWGALSDEFALCATGSQQSPIDILAANSEALPDIQFNYHPSALTIQNNGHTIQVDYAPGSSITVDGTEYSLLQFHFHHPSEHTVEGVVYPMELHLVHADEAGHLAVVGVLLKHGIEDNAAFAPIFEHLPVEAGDPQHVDGVTVNADDLLPTERQFYTYSGSLTTPPCSEGVRWLLLTTPVSISPAQVTQFSGIFEMDARPVQALGEREIRQDSGVDG